MIESKTESGTAAPENRTEFSWDWLRLGDDAWRDRAVVEIEGLRIPVISRAHLVLNKRTVGRPQDLLDADLLESSS